MDKYTILKGRLSQAGKIIPPDKIDRAFTKDQIEALIKKKTIKLTKTKDTSDGKEQTAAVDK